MKRCESKNRVGCLGPLWALHQFIKMIKEHWLGFILMQCALHSYVCIEFWWILMPGGLLGVGNVLQVVTVTERSECKCLMVLLPQHAESHWSSQRYLKPTCHMVRKRGQNRSLPRLLLPGFVIEWVLWSCQCEGEGIGN